MKKHSFWVVCVAAFAIGCSSQNTDTAASTTTGGTPVPAPKTATSGFASIQPILTKSCVGCHGAQNPKAGIDLTNYAGVIKGGTAGPIVVAGDPTKSLLIDALRGRNGATPMPKGQNPLPEDQIKQIEDWIKAGAKA